MHIATHAAGWRGGLTRNLPTATFAGWQHAPYCLVAHPILIGKRELAIAVLCRKCRCLPAASVPGLGAGVEQHERACAREGGGPSCTAAAERTCEQPGRTGAARRGRASKWAASPLRTAPTLVHACFGHVVAAAGPRRCRDLPGGRAAGAASRHMAAGQRRVIGRPGAAAALHLRRPEQHADRPAGVEWAALPQEQQQGGGAGQHGRRHQQVQARRAGRAGGSHGSRSLLQPVTAQAASGSSQT